MNHTDFWKNKRRWSLAAILTLLAAALVYAAYRPRPLTVEVAAVRSGNFEQVVEEDGQLRLKDRYVIHAPTQAALLRPTLKVGDMVRAGEVVATLEPVAPPMIDARSRAMLQQRLGSAEAAQHAASAQALRAQATLAQAGLEAQRTTRLAQEGFMSQAARDAATLARDAAQQAAGAALAEQDAAEHALAEARAALSRAEPLATGPHAGLWQLQSPVNGRVLKLHHDSAVTVAAGQPLLDIGDTAAMEAVIDVLSGDARQIQVGAEVRLSAGNRAAPMVGKVERVEPVAFTKVSALGIEEQRVNVVVALPTPTLQTQHLGDGFRVDARITLSSHAGALLAPTAALVRNDGQWRVFVVEGAQARARAVTLIDRNADVAWIASGLRADELVVLYPGSLVGDGQAVKTGQQTR